MDQSQTLFDIIQQIEKMHRFSETAHAFVESLGQDLASLNGRFAQLKAVFEDHARGIKDCNRPAENVRR
jgi:hypothetical protein